MPNDKEIADLAEELRTLPRQNALQRLVRAISDRVEVSIDETGRGYASIDANHRDRVYPLDSADFADFIISIALENAIPISNAALLQVVSLLGHQSRNRPRRRVFRRIGFERGKIYIDRGTEDRAIVEISTQGFRLLDVAPILFCRTSTMLALPLPIRQGSMRDIDRLVPQLDQRALKLFKGAIIAATHRSGPYFVTCLIGPQGSGKTSLARLARSLIDPCAEPLRTLPRREEDLWTIVSNEYAAFFDNVQNIPSWLSNHLCQISTGGARTSRRHYSNTASVTLSARCPLFLTSISMPINQPDLLDRCMVIHVPAMPCDKRQSEEQWQKEIDKAHPRLFGGLCNALAASLRNVNTVGVPGSVRMMDAAKWVTAAESALGFGPGEFVKLYSENQRDVRLGALDDDAFGTAVLEFTRTVRQFRGNVTQLEGRLSSYRLSRAVDWPAQKRIRRRLDELAPLLREHGVLVNTRLRGGPNNQKLIDLSSAIRLKRARATVPIRPANKV